jgi:glucosamine-6-phosphate deaminase
MDRRTEIRELLALPPEQVIARAADRLVVCDHLDTLHRHFADRVAGEIRAASKAGRPCRLILPVGPTGGYPRLAEIIRDESLDLSHCWFFFMDEYCGEDGAAVTADHPLSFKGVMRGLFFDRLEPVRGLRMEQVIFPDQQNVGDIATRIEHVGGIDVCLGGIGIHGHVAFNEPQSGVSGSDPRCVQLNDFTLTINAVRAGVGGNLECFPRSAFTLGMRQILSAGKIVLYCRNGTEFDWANTVLRLALFGNPGDDYPVTHIRNTDYLIVTDTQTLQSPVNLI